MEEIEFAMIKFRKKSSPLIAVVTNLRSILNLNDEEHTLDELIDIYRKEIIGSKPDWTITKMIGIPYDNN